MLAGIVAIVGQIGTVSLLDDNAGAGVRLSIDVGNLPLANVALGDSIAIQDACMAVVTKTDNRFEVDVSHESFSRTIELEGPGEADLEKALRLADHIGGHLMSGHADGLGMVAHFTPVNGSHELRVRMPAELGRCPAYKGFVVVNGVPLMVNTVRDDADGCEFSINLISHTVAVTTLKHLEVDSQANLEIDLIARCVEHMLTYTAISLPVGTQPLTAV